MPEFKFRLATLLRLRQSARDECRLRLADSQRAEEDLRDRMARLDAERARLRQRRRRGGGPGKVDVCRLAEIERYDAAIRDEVERLQRRRETLAVEIQHRRQSLIKADQDAQCLEKLHGKQLLRHRLAAERQEAKQLDDEMKAGWDKR